MAKKQKEQTNKNIEGEENKMSNQEQTNKKVEGEENKMSNQQQTETKAKEAVNTIKVFSTKESNENDVKIAEIVMNNLTEQERIREGLRKIELEIQKDFDRVNELTQKRKMEMEASTKKWEMVTKTISGLGTMAALTAITCYTSKNSRDVKMEQLRLGAEE